MPIPGQAKPEYIISQVVTEIIGLEDILRNTLIVNTKVSFTGAY